MQHFGTGKYLGKNTFQRKVGGIILTQNDYSADTVSEWHYHENPIIDFILKGGGVEIRKRGEIEFVSGMSAFCNHQEKHKNVKHVDGSKFFFIECERGWFVKMNIKKRMFEGNFVIENQKVKDLIPQIIFESKSENNETTLAIEALVVNLFSHFSQPKTEYSTAPRWLFELRDLLHDSPLRPFSLPELATRFGVHPVTISRLFPHFFGTTMGEYIRGIKLEKSFGMLAKKHIPLETIAHSCGFSDHAHFTRIFKKRKGVTPSQFRKIIFG